MPTLLKTPPHDLLDSVFICTRRTGAHCCNEKDVLGTQLMSNVVHFEKWGEKKALFLYLHLESRWSLTLKT